MNNLFLNKKLAEVQGMKSENLHLMRFIAAIMVLISHAFVIATGSMEGEWFVELTNDQLTMGGFAVSVFFLCGGYLIAMSVEKYNSAKVFFSARIKRLFPPLAFTIIATVFIGAFVSTMGPAFYVVSPDTWKYLLNIFFVRVHYLPGVFVGNPYYPTVNGSLWTLPVEFACYVLCFIAFKMTFMQKKRYPLTIPLVIIGSYLVWYLGGSVPLLREIIRPVLLFYIGMGFWIYREHITLSFRNFIISIVACVLLFVLGFGQVAMLFCFPYIMMYIWFGMKQCSSKIGKLGDYSYGIYLWAFPVQQAVVYYWKDTTMPVWLNVVISIPITMILGIITYEVAEKGFAKVWKSAKEVGFSLAFKEVKADIPGFVKKFKCPHIVYLALLVMVAMRHVNWGLDFWDTGYSYANFQYMGLDHMDYMWLFSTYLATLVGNFFTKLPFGHTLLGMNFYTTLIIVALVTVAYFFCVKALKMQRWVVFIGELLALGLAWCPSSVLYNYLTYLLFLLSAVFVYIGIVKEKKWGLFIAGIFLGMNVLTRFSNLPQMALIIAVWAYGIWEKQEGKEVNPWQVGFQRTLWCLGGYLTGAGVLLAGIHFEYGIDMYIAGIQRLFAMTENAADYQAQNMVLAVIYWYYENIKWLFVLLKYVLIGLAVWFVIDLLKRYCKVIRESFLFKTVLDVVATVACFATTYYVICELYAGEFCELYFYGYQCIESPAIVFMLITMIVVAIRVLQKKVDKKEKLLATMVLIILLISSIGGNNGVYTSFNNLFIAAPYTLWVAVNFIKEAGKKVIKLGKKENALEISLHALPFKCVFIGFMFVISIQIWLFADTFFFAEAKGEMDVVMEMENSETLKGIKMNPGKVLWMTDLCDYVAEHELEGKELITYGYIPSLSYYLQMPPAFNAWVVLDSYPATEMQLDLEELRQEIVSGTAEKPVIILDKLCPDFSEQPKWLMLKEFMEEYGYTCNFENGKFMLYEATK